MVGLNPRVNYVFANNLYGYGSHLWLLKKSFYQSDIKVFVLAASIIAAEGDAIGTCACYESEEVIAFK